MAAQAEPVLREMQSRSAALSSNSKHVVVERSWTEQPAVVVDAIRLVVEAARSGTPLH